MAWLLKLPPFSNWVYLLNVRDALCEYLVEPQKLWVGGWPPDSVGGSDGDWGVGVVVVCGGAACVDCCSDDVDGGDDDDDDGSDDTPDVADGNITGFAGSATFALGSMVICEEKSILFKSQLSYHCW